MSLIPKIAGNFETTLATKISASASSFTLNSITDKHGVVLANGTYQFTFDEGTTKEEHMIATIVGTAATIDYRGINPQNPLTTVTAQRKAHGKNAPIIVSDWPLLGILRNILAGEAGWDLPAAVKYASGVSGVDAQDLVTKAQMDAQVASGAVTYDQNKFSATAGETLSAFDLIYFKESDQRWWKCDADALATVQNITLGIAAAAVASAGNAVTVIKSGKISSMSGLTGGSKYFVSNTAGGLSTSPGTISRFIGWAESTTVFYFFPDGLPAGVIFDTAGENLVAGNLVYFKTSDQKWWKADADALATSVGVKLGFAQATISADAIGLIRIEGIDTSNASLTAGGHYFVSNSVGEMVVTTPGTFQRFVGRALSTNELLMGDNPFVLTQDGQQVYAADAGANDTYVITRVPAPPALKVGMVIWVKFNTANTGTATLADTGLAATTIVKGINTTLADGDIAAGSIHPLIYDGTNYRLIGPTDNAYTFGTLYKSGIASHSSGGGNQTIAHGLGRVPKHVRITCVYQGANDISSHSVGAAQDTSSENCVYVGQGGSDSNAGSVAGEILRLTDGASSVATASLGTLDGTNIGLTMATDSANFEILWEAWG